MPDATPSRLVDCQQCGKILARACRKRLEKHRERHRLDAYSYAAFVAKYPDDVSLFVDYDCPECSTVSWESPRFGTVTRTSLCGKRGPCTCTCHFYTDGDGVTVSAYDAPTHPNSGGSSEQVYELPFGSEVIGVHSRAGSPIMVVLHKENEERMVRRIYKFANVGFSYDPKRYELVTGGVINDWGVFVLERTDVYRHGLVKGTPEWASRSIEEPAQLGCQDE